MSTVKGDPLGGNIPIGEGISVLGSYRLLITLVNPYTLDEMEFIDNDCFDFLVLDEVAGLRLPMVRIGFKVYDYSVLSFLNQGNIIRVYVTSLEMNQDGSTKEEIGIHSTFVIIKPEIKSDANSKSILITGLYNNTEYINKRSARTFENMSSRHAMYWIASQNFTPDFGEDTEEPNDKQNWVQSNRSDKDFIKHLFIHSNYENSFPVIGITTDGTFRHRNFRYLVTQTTPIYKFLFSDSEQASNPELDTTKPLEIVHNGDIADVSNAGLMNLWRGSGVQIPVINMDSGGNVITYEGYIEAGMLSGNTFANRRRGSSPSILGISYGSENIYDGFYESKSRNLLGLSMYSSQVTALTYKWKLLPIKILDHIFFEEPDSPVTDGVTNNPLSPLSSGTSSGRYLISRVTRKITRKGILTRVEICRESPAEQLGDLS